MTPGRAPQNPGPTSATPPPPGAAPLLKAHEYAQERDWPKYYQAVAGKGPRDTLLKALEFFDKEPPPPSPRLAIDLGCGSGRDTFELLNRNWRVLATDSHPLAIELLQANVPDSHRPRLECRVAGFKDLDLPRADLVNASYALPFCEPADFAGLWHRIERSLPPGARFCGQFFGDRDSWASLPDRSHQTRQEVERLLKDFIIEHFNEVENREPSATGEIKDWHIFHVVARKRS